MQTKQTSIQQYSALNNPTNPRTYPIHHSFAVCCQSCESIAVWWMVLVKSVMRGSSRQLLRNCCRTAKGAQNRPSTAITLLSEHILRAPFAIGQSAKQNRRRNHLLPSPVPTVLYTSSIRMAMFQPVRQGALPSIPHPHRPPPPHQNPHPCPLLP